MLFVRCSADSMLYILNCWCCWFLLATVEAEVSELFRNKQEIPTKLFFCTFTSITIIWGKNSSCLPVFLKHLIYSHFLFRSFSYFLPPCLLPVPYCFCSFFWPYSVVQTLSYLSMLSFVGSLSFALKHIFPNFVYMHGYVCFVSHFLF